MVVHVVLPMITLETETVVVASPTAALDLVIKTDLEVKPSEAQLSLNYVPASPIHAPMSPNYHPGPDTEFEPFEDESDPIEYDTPKAAKPLPS
ncbi:hypothetical protein Tco_0493061 [Tanacetum coccineum]